MMAVFIGKKGWAMLWLGCHLSASGGYAAMLRTAGEIGANTFQFFTRNPRGGAAKVLAEDDVRALNEARERGALAPLLAHAPYTVNPCSAAEKTREFAVETLAGDLARLERTPGNFYNFHPGSHVGQGMERGIEQIAQALNTVLRPEQKTVVLLETMSGKGSEVGGRFEELREILDRCTLSQQVGVCLDTCHVHDAGYDLAGDLDGVLTEFDRVIGLSRLRALHLNDSKNPCGAHKDRHERLGQGYLGLDALVRIVRHPALRGLPMVLETPNDLSGYAEEITLLRRAARTDAWEEANRE